MNEENLRILAAFLRKYAAGETDVKAEFDMGLFSFQNYSDKSHCGTAGCAVGFAPFAGIIKAKDEDWTDYSYRNFIQEKYTSDWSWCFDQDWEFVDNTPLGAAQRIEALLDSGLPENWHKQMTGVAPLSYKDL